MFGRWFLSFFSRKKKYLIKENFPIDIKPESFAKIALMSGEKYVKTWSIKRKLIQLLFNTGEHGKTSRF